MKKLLLAFCLSFSSLVAEPFLGEIRMVGFNFAPRGWALCDGAVLPISSNTALFSLLGTTYGGDGRTTFALPDLRGRVPVHVGTGSGLSPVSWGQRGGTETFTPNSPVSVVSNGNVSKGRNTIGSISTSSKNITNQTSQSTKDPYLGVYFIISLTGIFPSRS